MWWPNSRPPQSVSRQHPAARMAFTLWELLLVLAILLTVAAVTWPSVQRLLEHQRLHRAAQDVWNELTATRLRAIESGVVCQFRYEMDGRRWISAAWEAELAASSSSGAAPGGSELVARAGELPEGTVFAPASDDPVPVEQLPPSLLASLPIAGGLGGAGWSQPLLFYSDGSSSGGGLRVVSDDGRFCPVTVRGLTGATSVGKVERLGMQR